MSHKFLALAQTPKGVIYGNVHEWAFAKGNEKWH